MSFLKHGISKDASPSGLSPAPASQPAPEKSGDVQRALIKVVLKNTLHRQGIPLEWLACEIITETHASGEETLHIQLVLMKWHETFLRYAPALEQHLRRGLDRFDPKVDHSKYVISWRFSPECGCPFKVMPPAKFWSHEEAPVEEAKVTPAILERRHEPLVPVGKRTARAPAPPVHGVHVPDDEETRPSPLSDDDYERTQLSPLR